LIYIGAPQRTSTQPRFSYWEIVDVHKVQSLQLRNVRVFICISSLIKIRREYGKQIERSITWPQRVIITLLLLLLVCVCVYV
jgi:hypothetical protein